MLLSDIDDTMTSEGMLPAKSLQAMETVRDAGILHSSHRSANRVVRSYRPQWPVDAVVGENGRSISPMTAPREMRSVFTKGEEERRLDRDRLETLRAKFWPVPGLALPLIGIIEWPILQSITVKMWRVG